VLEWASRRWGDQVVFLGIVFEDTEANTKRFLADNGWGLTQLFDPDSTVAVDYAVAGVPETYFIDRKGIITSKHAMPIDPDTMAARIKEIL
jgi:cytochrome c biogenesis protein CcmG, thiol:disulfide interchange protein DsbE